MVGGQQSARSLVHFAEIFRLADAAGLLEQPELAVGACATALAARRRRLNGGIVRDFSGDHRWLSINTATVRGAGGLGVILEACARHGIRAISPWRDQVAGGLDATKRPVREHGFELSGYCRGGMFPARTLPAATRARRQPARDRRGQDAERACLVLVVGGLPGALAGAVQRRTCSQRAAMSTTASRRCSSTRRASRMPLAIEPLHPMYAADRACVNTMEHALDLCDALDPAKSGALGVAVDVYHVWWDPKLEAQIARAGRERLLAFHVCDWLVPTRDLLEDRGMMGDGVIEIPASAPGSRRRASRATAKSRSSRARTGGGGPPTRCSPSASSGTAASSEKAAEAAAGASAVRPRAAHVEGVAISSAWAMAMPSHTSLRPMQVHQRAEDERRDRLADVEARIDDAIDAAGGVRRARRA